MAEAYYIFVLLYPGVSFVDLKKEANKNSLLNIYNNIKRNSDIQQIEGTINNFIGLREEGEIISKMKIQTLRAREKVEYTINLYYYGRERVY